jgi:ATP-binding protein involved in chromosome partitioning
MPEIPEGKISLDPDAEKIAERLSDVRHVVIVLSGKGGVGKSTVAANLATGLARMNYSVGLMDTDVHGPSVPAMMGVLGARPGATDNGVKPVETRWNVKTMSISYFLSEKDTAVIWRGPMKAKLIRQFLRDIEWGALDFLIVDSPPGTGDEPLSVVQLIPNAEGAILVTTPQEVALDAVRRSVSFCRAVSLPVLGIVENMSGYLCPHCGKRSEPFSTGGGRKLADDAGVPFLGEIPLAIDVTPSGDTGVPVVVSEDSEAGRLYRELSHRLAEMLEPATDSKQ